MFRRFLVIKLSAIGDVIHALPVAQAIKRTYPDSHLTWVVEPLAYDLVALSPHINQIIVFPKKEFKTVSGFLKNFIPFRKRLRLRQYDAVLDLQGLGKSAAIAMLAKSEQKLGTADMRELSWLISKPIKGQNQHGHIVDRYLDVAKSLGIDTANAGLELNIPDTAFANLAKLFKQAGGNIQTPFTVLAVGANWPNKRWSTGYYARLSDLIYNEGYIPVLVGSGAVDAGLANEIISLAEVPPLNLVGKTTLPDLAGLISLAVATIGGDTGAVHLSAELKVPTIMLMGPTNADRNGPYGQPANAIEVDRPCKHCWQRACPKGFDCLELITVEEVFAKLQPFLKSNN